MFDLNGLGLSSELVGMLFHRLAVLAVMAAGFLIMVGARRLAGRVLLAALVLIVVAAFGPHWLPKP